MTVSGTYQVMLKITQTLTLTLILALTLTYTWPPRFDTLQRSVVTVVTSMSISYNSVYLILLCVEIL